MATVITGLAAAYTTAVAAAGTVAGGTIAATSVTYKAYKLLCAACRVYCAPIACRPCKKKKPRRPRT